MPHNRIEKRSIIITADPAGGTGTSGADVVMELHDLCEVLAVKIDYSASTPTTCDVAISDNVDGSNILTVNNTATDKKHYPVIAASKAADGTGSTLTEVTPISEALHIVVAQSNPGEQITLDFYVTH